MDDITASAPAGALAEGLSVEVVRAVVAQACQQTRGGGGKEVVALISTFEDVKNALTAGQAQLALALRDVREEQATQRLADTVREGEAWETRRREHELALAHRSAVSEVALARRESPHRAARLIGLAQVLATEMPHTWDAFRHGRITPWRATLMARETACLSLQDRRSVDREMAEVMDRLSDRELEAQAKRWAYQLDPRGVVAAADRQVNDRHVSTRPVSPTMLLLTALLPMKQGIAVHGALLRAAESARAQGDPRGKSQIMADTLVERLTGQADADAVPLEVQVVISDEALFGASQAPARIPGYGPIPATIARRMITSDIEIDPDSHIHTGRLNPLDTDARVFLRRLYTDPAGQLIAMESTRRLFPPGLAHFIAARDGHICRTPYCSAPIRHVDHVTPSAHGGKTTAANAQGLCQWCNQAKEAPGWHTRSTPDGVITLTTPTGTEYSTTPPPLPTPGHPSFQTPRRRTPRRARRHLSPSTSTTRKTHSPILRA